MEFKKLSIEELKKNITTGLISLDNGEKRKFDLLDFYLMSNFSISTFLNQVRKKSTVDDMKKITQFFSIFLDRKGQIEIANIKDLLSIDYSCKGRVLTELEKRQIITFLNNNFIPINQATYLCAIRKYYAGILDIYNFDVQSNNESYVKRKKI